MATGSFTWHILFINSLEAIRVLTAASNFGVNEYIISSVNISISSRVIIIIIIIIASGLAGIG